MRAVFDRDNTLTKDEGYCHLIEDFAWLTVSQSHYAFARTSDPCLYRDQSGRHRQGYFYAITDA